MKWKNKLWLAGIANSGWHMMAALLVLLCSGWMAGCNKEDEPIPAYLHIEPFVLNATNPDRHGSISEKITNARLFLRNKTTGVTEPLGTIPLPATIPVLQWGETEINIDPIIKANGNTFYLQIYPFYQRYTATIYLVADEETTVQLGSTYKDEAVFSFIEDFEQPGILFDTDLDDNPSTKIERSDETPFEGEFSGKISLDTANNFMAAATNEVFNLGSSNVGKVYMEVNYKTDVPMEFGILPVDDQGAKEPIFEFVVLARDEWNKIYFDLTDLVSTSGVSRFLFIFRTGIPYENGAFQLNEAEVYLDNIKLVHF